MNRIAALFIVMVAWVSPISSAEPRVYQPQGAPVDPKVPVQWNRYHDYTQATELLKAMAEKHPERARLISLGQSHGQREMWVLILTNPATGDHRSKPALWIDGGIHANEIQGTQVALYTAWYLLEMDGRNDFITRLLSERTFYILPMLSPDARDAHMYEPNTTHSPRSGLRPVDDDRDGLVDEDGPDDLDGDGHITMMRIADPNGRFKPHPDYPNLMVQAKPGEKGGYRLLGLEGIDNDGDGQVNEDGPGGYDPNRNWAWQWQPEYVQRGAHLYPFSILENRVAADFITDHPNIAAAQSFHNTGGMILRGPGSFSDEYAPQDLPVFDTIGRQGEKLLPGYKYLELRKDLYPALGGEIDWLYAMRGTISYTNELFTSFNYFRQEEGGGYFGTTETQHVFDKYLLLGDGLVDWKEVDHPTYGRIEVGGFKKNWVRQPPSFLLEEECHRNMAFCLYHADQMPRVSIQSVTTKDLGGGVVEITAVVENTRVTPTRLAVDLRNKLTAPDVATLTGRDAKVLVAMTSDEPFFVKPTVQKNATHPLKVPSLAGHGVLYLRWLATGNGPWTVNYQSVKGGSATATTASQ